MHDKRGNGLGPSVAPAVRHYRLCRLVEHHLCSVQRSLVHKTNWLHEIISNKSKSCVYSMAMAISQMNRCSIQLSPFSAAQTILFSRFCSITCSGTINIFKALLQKPWTVMLRSIDWMTTSMRAHYGLYKQNILCRWIFMENFRNTLMIFRLKYTRRAKHLQLFLAVGKSRTW